MYFNGLDINVQGTWIAWEYCTSTLPFQEQVVSLQQVQEPEQLVTGPKA